MQVLIIEDEQPAATKLEALMKQLDPGITIVGRLGSVLTAINWLHTHPQPDLIFMDVQLEDGICFEIFDAVKSTAPVIFTTAYDAYALRAFRVNSVDYLLKPIEREALVRALEKFSSLFKKDPGARLDAVDLYHTAMQGFKTRFFVKVSNHFKSIPIERVDCFLVFERAVFLRTREGDRYDVDYSLDQVQKLVDPKLFFRINRNYLVHIDAIRDIYSYSPGRLGIRIDKIDHLELLVSRDKVPAFKKWLDR